MKNLKRKLGLSALVSLLISAIIFYSLASFITAPGSGVFLKIVPSDTPSALNIDFGYGVEQFLNYFGRNDSRLERVVLIFQTGAYWMAAFFLCTVVLLLWFLASIINRLYRERAS